MGFFLRLLPHDLGDFLPVGFELVVILTLEDILVSLWLLQCVSSFVPGSKSKKIRGELIPYMVSRGGWRKRDVSIFSK